jgi:hypothetical protein
MQQSELVIFETRHDKGLSDSSKTGSSLRSYFSESSLIGI